MKTPNGPLEALTHALQELRRLRKNLANLDSRSSAAWHILVAAEALQDLGQDVPEEARWVLNKEGRRDPWATEIRISINALLRAAGQVLPDLQEE